MKQVKYLLDELNINYKNLDMYERALTHASYLNEHPKELSSDYERLEYLGDAVLDLIIAEYLYKKDNSDEGVMSKLRAKYVCEEALYEYSKVIKLNEYIKLSRGEEKNGGANKPSILSDAFEALLAAIYLDLGFVTAKQFIYEFVIPIIENHQEDLVIDYKSKLQELVQTDKRSINYSIIDESGPAHNKQFISVVKMDEIILGEGKGRSKQSAEKEAAKNALSKLAKNKETLR